MPLITKRDNQPPKGAEPVAVPAAEPVAGPVEEHVEAVIEAVEDGTPPAYVIERGQGLPPKFVPARRLAQPVNDFGGAQGRTAHIEVKLGDVWKPVEDGAFWRTYIPADRASARALRGVA